MEISHLLACSEIYFQMYLKHQLEITNDHSVYKHTFILEYRNVYMSSMYKTQ